MVTQVEIARRCKLDVSSVNKILNRRKGPVFKKETVTRVFRVARQLGYDLGGLKHSHERIHPRKAVRLPLEICIYRSDGSLHDRGKAVAEDLSLSGALLTGLMLPDRTLPVAPFKVGIRFLDGPLKDLEMVGEPVRLAHKDGVLKLAIKLKSEEPKLEALRKLL